MYSSASTTAFLRSALSCRGRRLVVALVGLTSCVAGAATAPAFAASSNAIDNFNPMADFTWEAPTNWSLGYVPGINDAATMNFVIALKTGGAINIQSLTMTGNSYLEFNTSCTLSSQVSMLGTYNFLELDGDAATTLTIANGTTITGSLYQIGTSYNSGSYFNGSNHSSTINNGSLTANMSTSNASMFNLVNNGSIQAINGESLAILGTTNSSTSNNSTINVMGGGGLTYNGSNNASGNITVAGGKISFSGANAGVITATQKTTSSGALSGSNTNSVSIANGTLDTSGVFTSTAGTVNLTGVTLSKGTATFTGGTLNLVNGLVLDTQTVGIGASVNLSSSAFTLSNGSSLLLSGNRTLSSSASFINYRDSLLLDGSVAGGSIMTIASDVSLTGNLYQVGQAYQGSGGNVATVNYGTLVANASAYTSTLYNLTNNGTVQASGEKITLQNFSGNAFRNNGVLKASINSVIDASSIGITQSGSNASTQVDGTLTTGSKTLNLVGGALSGTGTVSGQAGTIAVNNSGGVINPGDSSNSVGMLSLTGDYVQSAGGGLLIDIGGTNAAADYDVLSVNGAVSLGGTVSFTFINGYQPVAGQVFSFLNANSFTGSFSNIAYQNAPSGSRFAVTQNGNTYQLVTLSGSASSPEPGSLLLLLSAGMTVIKIGRKSYVSRKAGFHQY